MSDLEAIRFNIADPKKTTEEKKEYLTKEAGYKVKKVFLFEVFTEKELENFKKALDEAIAKKSDPIEKNEDREKMMVFLSDIDNDDMSEAGEENWYAGEAMLRESLLGLSPEKFERLIGRLGLKMPDYRNDPENFKKRFVEELGIRLASKIPLSVILSGRE